MTTIDLAAKLREHMCQDSVLVMAADKTEWHSRREA